MKIENEKEYDEALVFLDQFFEDPEGYTKEDAAKVKDLLAAVSEYEKLNKSQK